MGKEKKKYQARCHYYHECVIIGLKFNRRSRAGGGYSFILISRAEIATIQQDLTSRYIIFNSIACSLRDINYTLKSTLTLNFRLYIFRAEIRALNLLSNEAVTRKINAISGGIIKTEILFRVKARKENNSYSGSIRWPSPLLKARGKD